MAMRGDIINAVRDILGKLGFFVSEPHNIRSISFDVVGRRDDKLLFIKVLINVDAFTRANAEELAILAETLKGSPMLIGLHSGSGELENGVVYSRFGVPIMSMDSFHDFFVEGVPPYVFAAPGGLYVHLDKDVLKLARERKGLSLGSLAEVAGVSRRTIQMYEDGMGAVVDAALRLEDYLGEELIVPVNPFSYSRQTKQALSQFDMLEGISRNVFSRLNDLGFEIMPTCKCPFDALTKDDQVVLLTGVGRYGEALRKKARLAGNIASIAEREAVVFTDRTRKVSLEGTAVIRASELRKVEDGHELYQLVLERRLG